MGLQYHYFYYLKTLQKYFDFYFQFINDFIQKNLFNFKAVFEFKILI